MRIYADRWSAHKKSAKVAIPNRCNVEILAAGIGELALLAHPSDPEDGSACIVHAGLNRIYIKGNFDGYAALEVVGKEFGMSVSVNGVELAEPLDMAPPPPRKQSKNLVGKLRDRFRAEQGNVREAFDNDTGLPGHEIDDDEPVEFEEEQIARINEQQQQQQEENDDGELDSQDTADDPGPDEGNSGS